MRKAKHQNEYSNKCIVKDFPSDFMASITGLYIMIPFKVKIMIKFDDTAASSFFSCYRMVVYSSK